MMHDTYRVAVTEPDGTPGWAISCERHMPILAKACVHNGRTPNGVVTPCSEPCPVCVWVDRHGDQLLDVTKGHPELWHPSLDPEMN